MWAKSKITVGATLSTLLLVLKKSTGMDIFYFLFLSSITCFFAMLCVYFSGNTRFTHLFNNRRSDVSAAIIILLYGVILSGMSVARHDAYSTNMYDLGNMDQAIWNSSNGNFLEVTAIGAPCSNVPRSINHLEWIYLVFAIIYKAIDDVRLLLVVQTFFVCIGLVGLYHLSKSMLRNPALRVISLGCIALYPMLHFANLFDFHGDLLAFPFLVWMVYFYNVRKNRFLSGIMIMGALLCKEYAALPLAFYGIILILDKKDWRWGTAVTLISIGYFFIALYGIMPWFNNGKTTQIISAVYKTEQGVDLIGLIPALTKNPQRLLSLVFSMHTLESLFYIIFPMFFFLYKKPIYLLPVIPIIIKDLLVGIDIGSHRLALSIPFLFVTFLYALQKIESEAFVMGNLERQGYRLKIALIASATLIASITYGPSPLGHRFYREITKYVKNSTDCTRDSIMTLVPDTGVVSASGNLTPHCTHRRYCYQFPRPFIADCSDAKPVDIIALDTNDEESRVGKHHGFYGETIPWIISMGFTQVKELGGVYLFKKSTCVNPIANP
jgi:uncharacterized membrane protein